MTKDEMREIAIEVAKSHLGEWYIWGGDDPSGFDCSGFIIEILKSVGILPRSGDWTADALARRPGWKITSIPLPGDLVFWHSGFQTDGGGDDRLVKGRIIHVEMVLNSQLSIGASGGGSRTLTRGMAIRHNAFIKIRPIHSRSNLWGYVNPY